MSNQSANPNQLANSTNHVPRKTTNLSLIVVALLGAYLLVTSTTYPIDSLFVFDAKRIIQLALFTVLMVLTVAWTPLRRSTIAQLSRLSPLNRIFLSVFFAIGIASSVRLEHSAYALVDVSMMLLMMVLIAITAASRDLAGSRFDKWAVVFLAATGFFVLFQESMGYLAGWALGTEFNYNLSLMHFAHPRFYNQLQTWSIPVLGALPLLFPAKRWIKLVCIALLGLQWFLIIAVSARGTFISLFISMTFIALWLPEQRKFWLRYQLAGLMAGIVIYTGALFLNTVFIPQTQSGQFYAHSVGRSIAHTSGRSTLWRLSVEDATNYPLLGAGPTRYACDSELTLPAHPHSFMFKILGEWGVVALLLTFFLVFKIGLGLLRNLKSRSSENNTGPALRAILSTSLLAGVIHSCLSGLLIMPASQITMILVAGFVLSLSPNAKPKTIESTTGVALLFTGLLIATATLVFALKEIPQLAERTNLADLKSPMVPRFWQNGRVCEYSYSNPEQ